LLDLRRLRLLRELAHRGTIPAVAEALAPERSAGPPGVLRSTTRCRPPSCPGRPGARYRRRGQDAAVSRAPPRTTFRAGRG